MCEVLSGVSIIGLSQCVLLYYVSNSQLTFDSIAIKEKTIVPALKGS